MTGGEQAGRPVASDAAELARTWYLYKLAGKQGAQQTKQCRVFGWVPSRLHMMRATEQRRELGGPSACPGERLPEHSAGNTSTSV